MIVLRWTALVLGLLLFGNAAARGAPLDEALYSELLARHTVAVQETVGTRVDYRALRDSADWQRLIANLAQVDPDALASRDEKLAFWINAYNILAIDVVRKGYPVGSIRDLGSLFSPIWDREAGRIGGQTYTLGQIEHEILRPLGDPRIHVAIVCASTSCPSLRREAFSATRLDEQLDDSFRDFLANREKGLAVRAKGSVRLSKIFDWFEEDFEEQGGVLAVVRRYAPEELQPKLSGSPRISYFPYDWSLNEATGS